MKSSRLRLRRSTSSQPPVANDGSPSLGERRLHYERGSTIYATDGRVGVLTQVVVGEAAGEVTDLIVRIDNADADVLLPPDLVDRTVDSAIFLTINRAQFSERAADAARVNPSEFTKANPKTVSKNGLTALERNPRRAVITASPNHLDTLAASGSRGRDRLQSTAGAPIAARQPAHGS